MRHSFVKVLIGLAGVGALLWLLFGYFGVQALFTDRVVDEGVPVAALLPVMVVDVVGTSTASTVMNQENVGTSSTVFGLVARGEFQQGDSTYSIQGAATITNTERGRILSFTDFRVTNGPDLFVYVVSASDPQNDAVKGAVREERFVNLGALKGNQGNQTYLIPDDVHLDESSVVSVWCRRFGRNFGAAPLGLAP